MEQGSDDIQALIALMARLPGLGPRSARRIVLLVRRRSRHMVQLSQLCWTGWRRTRANVVCGNITDRDECAICTDPARATGSVQIARHGR